MKTTSEMTNKRALATLVASKGEEDLCGQIKENNFRELIEIVFFSRASSVIATLPGVNVGPIVIIRARPR